MLSTELIFHLPLKILPATALNKVQHFTETIVIFTQQRLFRNDYHTEVEAVS